MKSKKLIKRIKSGDLNVVNDLFEEIDNVWQLKKGFKLNQSQYLVLAISYFNFEVNNGGYMQFMDHQCNVFCYDLPKYFKEIGLDEFAIDFENYLSLFPKPLKAENEKDLSEKINKLYWEVEEKIGEEKLESYEDKFWELVNENESYFLIPLLEYVKSHAIDFENLPNKLLQWIPGFTRNH